jgi:hypothetical protein
MAYLSPLLKQYLATLISGGGGGLGAMLGGGGNSGSSPLGASATPQLGLGTQPQQPSVPYAPISPGAIFPGGGGAAAGGGGGMGMFSSLLGGGNNAGNTSGGAGGGSGMFGNGFLSNLFGGGNLDPAPGQAGSVFDASGSPLVSGVSTTGGPAWDFGSLFSSDLSTLPIGDY